MNNSYFIAFTIVVFSLSAFLVRLFSVYAIQLGFSDIPNHRSIHLHTTPRGGGCVFVLLWLILLMLIFFQLFITTPISDNVLLRILGLSSLESHHISFLKKGLLLLIPSTVSIALLGLWDDYQSLSAKTRLLFQFLIGAGCLLLLDPLPSSQLFQSFFHHNTLSESAFFIGCANILMLVGMVWSINLFNFMDGIDGLAGLEALSVLTVGGWLFWLENSPFCYLIWLLTAAIGGFLLWNWPKARIFMGDSGSYCLGLLIALFAIIGDSWYNISMVYWFILYGVFWMDATLTLIRRTLAKKSLAEAHQDHAYQRIFAAGIPTKTILCSIFCLNSILMSITIWTRLQPEYLFYGLCIALSILLIAFTLVEKIKPFKK